MRLQTLSKKYRNMTLEADVMVQILEDVVEKSLEDTAIYRQNIRGNKGSSEMATESRKS